MKEETCNQELGIGCDDGENQTFFNCQLPKGHKEPHQERGKVEHEKKDGTLTECFFDIKWDNFTDLA